MSRACQHASDTGDRDILHIPNALDKHANICMTHGQNTDIGSRIINKLERKRVQVYQLNHTTNKFRSHHKLTTINRNQ